MGAPSSRRGCGCSSSLTPIRRPSPRATATSSSGRASRPGISISTRAPCASCCAKRAPCASRCANANGAVPRDGAARLTANLAAGLQLDDVLSRWALLTLYDVELDPLAFGERLEALCLNRGVVHEAVLLAVLRRDETETLRVVEPLHDPSDTCHLAGTPLRT